MKTKIKIILSAVVLALVLVTVGCKGSATKESTETQQEAEKKQYTCSMHPEVVQDEPGDCPECGMELVEKKAEMEHSHGSHVH